MNREEKFIKECLSAYLGKTDLHKLSNLSHRINENKLAAIISNHNLGGLFHHLISTGCFEEITFSPKLISNWKKAAWKNTFVNSLNDTEASILAKELDNNKINYAYIKGAVCRKYYENDYIRSSVDIDLFIDKKDYLKTKEIFLNNKYEIPVEYYMNADIKLDLSEFEKHTKEISFVKKIGQTQYITDLQWDFIGFEKSSLFQRIYEINDLFLTCNSDIIQINNYLVKTLTPDKELYIMAFHYCFHHGFRGLKWLLDICTYINLSGMTTQDMVSGLSESGSKIIGISVMLANELSGNPQLSKTTKKILHVDKLLPFEYLFYKSMLFKIHQGVFASITSRILKMLLPYRFKDKVRATNYLIFNSSSLFHRIDLEKPKRRLLHPFSLIKIIISDAFRHRRKTNEKND